VGGEVTWEHPEVGYLTKVGCTGTLVGARNVVLTAAHCIGYHTGDDTDVVSTSWRAQRSAQSPKRYYRVVAYRSFGRRFNQEDFALLRLAHNVEAGTVPEVA